MYLAFEQWSRRHEGAGALLSTAPSAAPSQQLFLQEGQAAHIEDSSSARTRFETDSVDPTHTAAAAADGTTAPPPQQQQQKPLKRNKSWQNLKGRLSVTEAKPIQSNRTEEEEDHSHSVGDHIEVSAAPATTCSSSYARFSTDNTPTAANNNKAPSRWRTLASLFQRSHQANDNEDYLTAEGGDAPSSPTLAELEDLLVQRIQQAQVVFIHHESSFQRIILSSRMLDDALTPMGWMLFLDAVYTFILLIFSIVDAAESAKMQQLSAWSTYEVMYFRVVNSTALSSFLVSSCVACILQRKPIRSSAYCWFAFLMLLPPLLTHCLMGFVLFAPVLLPILAVVLWFEQWSRKKFRTGKTSRHVNRSFMVRACARVLLNFAAALVISASFNYAILYVYDRGAHGNPEGYGEVIALEFVSRNLVCTVDSISRSAANVLQSLSAIGPSLF